MSINQMNPTNLLSQSVLFSFAGTDSANVRFAGYSGVETVEKASFSTDLKESMIKF